MILDAQIVDTYLAQGNIDKFKTHWIYTAVGQGKFKGKNIFTKPSSRNSQNVKMLYAEIKQCLAHFEPFNRGLWDILFKNWSSVLQRVKVYLTVGLPEPNDATVIKSPSGDNVIILDVGCWIKYLGHTDITQLVRNIITHECCHICIQADIPIINSDYESGTYLMKLNSLVFNEGLAHLLSFCEDINSYDWNNSEISDVKSRSLSKLREAVAEPKTEKQNLYLYNAMFGNYFDKFGCMIGMLYFREIYQKSKGEGLLKEYLAGHKNIIAKILNFYN